MPTFVQILDFIGTFAFAISGIRLASAKRFDWFGAYVVGFVTAIGGGTIRDLLLDVTPGWMTDPIYLICTGLALLWVILFGKHLIHLHNTFFIFDSIGLALFTVVGVGKSIALGYPFWVAIIMGSITGAAGGVIRDVFINEIPLIFRKEIYAMACVVGGTFYWMCHLLGMESFVCQIVGGVTVFVTRILAVKYRICLPILSGNERGAGRVVRYLLSENLGDFPANLETFRRSIPGVLNKIPRHFSRECRGILLYPFLGMRIHPFNEPSLTKRMVRTTYLWY